MLIASLTKRVKCELFGLPSKSLNIGFWPICPSFLFSHQTGNLHKILYFQQFIPFLIKRRFVCEPIAFFRLQQMLGFQGHTLRNSSGQISVWAHLYHIHWLWLWTPKPWVLDPFQPTVQVCSSYSWYYQTWCSSEDQAWQPGLSLASSDLRGYTLEEHRLTTSFWLLHHIFSF